MEEKDRVRRQETLKRDERLRQPAVRQFVREMESRRLFRDRFVSVFDLMRDGVELVDRLRFAQAAGDPLWTVVDPYVEVVADTETCASTGLRLGDIWHCFRLTWVNQYSSIPGRQMHFLIRDRAAPFHPIIGIAALGSSVVQIAGRDQWMGGRQSKFSKG